MVYRKTYRGEVQQNWWPPDLKLIKFLNRHVRVFHSNKDEDDPELREALAAQPSDIQSRRGLHVGAFLRPLPPTVNRVADLSGPLPRLSTTDGPTIRMAKDQGGNIPTDNESATTEKHFEISQLPFSSPVPSITAGIVWHCGYCGHGPMAGGTDMRCSQCARGIDGLALLQDTRQHSFASEVESADDHTPNSSNVLMQPIICQDIRADLQILQDTDQDYSGDSTPPNGSTSNESLFRQNVYDGQRQTTADNQSDASSVSSVPSMFSGTTLSSLSSAHAKINVATEELVALLHNDHGLRPLFDTALQRCKPNKFEKKFTKLLKIYAVELRQAAGNELEKGAVRLVYSQRKFIANCIRRVYVLDSSDTVEELHQLITQNPAKDQQLEKFFHEMDLVPKALPNAADPDDGQSSDDSDMGDPEQPYLPNLTQVRKFMTSGVAFANLRKNLDRFLNPHNTGETRGANDRKRQRSPSIDDSTAENHKRFRGPHLDDTATEVVEPDLQDATIPEETKITLDRKRQRSPSFDQLLEPLPKRLQRSKVKYSKNNADVVVESESKKMPDVGFAMVDGKASKEVKQRSLEELMESVQVRSAELARWRELADSVQAESAIPVPLSLEEISLISDHVSKLEAKHNRPFDEVMNTPEVVDPQTRDASVEIPEFKAQRHLSLPEFKIFDDEPETHKSSNKEHKCPYCSTEFTRHHNLKSHLLTHNLERPYVCQTCNSRFRRLHELKRHAKLHTGERHPGNTINAAVGSGLENTAAAVPGMLSDEVTPEAQFIPSKEFPHLHQGERSTEIYDDNRPSPLPAWVRQMQEGSCQRCRSRKTKVSALR